MSQACFGNIDSIRRVGLRGRPALSYKRTMPETTYFPRRLILAGAMISGVLLALAVHMLGARFGLDLGGLWRSDRLEFMPAGAAVAWWLIATVGFSGGYFTATLMDSAVSGQIPQRVRQFLIAAGVLVLAGGGAGGRGSGGRGAESDPDNIRRARRSRGAVPCCSDGVLRRAFCAAQGLNFTRRRRGANAKRARTIRATFCPNYGSRGNQLAARRLTLLSANVVSFLSVAFSSSRVFCKVLAQSLRPSCFAHAIRLP